MKVAIGSDHAGYELKQILRGLLEADGHSVTDCGPPSADHSDYPDYAAAVARLVSNREADRGVLVCGTGIGMGIAANKFTGVRAAVCWDAESTRLARAHNDANVLCVGGRVVSVDEGKRMLEVFVKTPHSGEERHLRRVEKVNRIDSEELAR